MKSFVTFLPLLGLALTACGSLNGSTGTAPTLATLSGSLSNPKSLAVPGAVRVAVVWRTGTQGEFNVAEDLPVQPVFPSAFTIKFDGPPPIDAMNSGTLLGGSSSTGGGSGSTPPSGASGGSAGSPGTGDPVVTPSGPDAGAAPSGPNPQHAPRNGSASLSFALGSVVAYVDQNGNGKLDLVTSGASAYVDTIVAANPEQAIAYFQGPVPTDGTLKDAFGNLPAEGYNIVTIPDCTVIEPLSGGGNPKCTTPVDAGPATCPQLQWFDMSRPYTLTVTSSPEVASLMCSSQASSPAGESSGTGTEPAPTGSSGVVSEDGGALVFTGPPPTPQPAQYPSPCDPNLECATDGSQYFYNSCTTISRGICQGTISSCSSVGVTRPSPTPAGWPCQD